MNLTVQFLESETGTYLTTTPDKLQLRQLEKNVALGVRTQQPKKSEDGTPIVGETQEVFVPLVFFNNVTLTVAKDEPLIQPAASIPNLPVPKKSRKRSN